MAPYCLAVPPLREAVDALRKIVDDGVQILDEGLYVDEQTGRGGDEEGVDKTHMREVVCEGRGGVRAEKAVDAGIPRSHFGMILFVGWACSEGSV